MLGMPARRLAIAAIVFVVAAGPLHGQSSHTDAILERRIEELTRQIERHPDAAALLVQRAELHQSGDRWEAMRADLDRALDISPRNAWALTLRALAAGVARDFDRALADLDASLAIEPRSAVALGMRGNVLMHLGRLDEAMAAFTRSIAEKPLPSAYAELGEFGTARTLQERAVAVSHFAPDFHAAATRRLQVIRNRQPIREATVPLGILPRPMQEFPRTIGLDEALAAPADVLGTRYLQDRTLVTLCGIAKGGATIEAVLDERPLTITAANADRVQRGIEARLTVFAQAIRRRGHARLAAGYRAEATAGCAAWGLDGSPVLVEQDDADLFLTQGNVRHMGVVVESHVVFRHDMNTSIFLAGRIDGERLVFVTADRGGFTGAADQRCTLTLIPAGVTGADWAMPFAGRALAFQSYGDYARMLADLERSLELRPDAEVSAMRTYLLATCPDAKVRDGRRALAAAEATRRLADESMELMVQSCLAVANAEAGDFAAAVRHQKRVVDLVPAEEKPLHLDRLRLFEARKPFHEQRPN